MNDFITLEGGEGTGKTTLALALKAAFEAQGRGVVLTREPGGCPVADRLRRIVTEGSAEIVPLTELLIFVAARAQHVDEVIRPALERGDVVICDRFTGSSVALQGYGRGLDVDMIHELNALATGGLRPGVTLLLDAPASVGLERALSRGGKEVRFEMAGLAFHERVRSGYLAEASRDPRYLVVDAHQPPEAVVAAALALMRERGVLNG